MDIQCFQKDDPNCIKVFVNNIKGYAHKIKAYPLVNREDKPDGLLVKPHFAKQNVLTVNREDKPDGLLASHKLRI